MNRTAKRSRDVVRPSRARSARPLVEGLEDRLLLFATSGDFWVNPARVTFSFMPDGTSIGGVSSSLFSTLNSYYATSTWQGTLTKAAAAWESAATGTGTAANINLVLVSDDGSAVGSGSYQQGAPNFGDIRIGAMPLPSGVLAEAFMPPASNGGSEAGDIILNSNVNWGTSGYDLLTVALHEFGHALGADHSTISTAEMYSTYTSVKQTLTSDDVAAIAAIYGTRTAGTNTNYTTAPTVSFNASNQATLTGVQIASAYDQDWYKVVVPTNTSGTLTITMQSSNMSSLAPRLTVYNSAVQGLAQASSTAYGGTVTISLAGVVAGQTYYIRASANVSGVGSAGAYGLNINAGTGTMSAVTPPDTTVAAVADGSSSSTLSMEHSGGRHGHGHGHGQHHESEIVRAGRLKGKGDYLMANVHALRRGRVHH